ncbi:hypothetical protein GCM10017687_74360 [Streptomyces echinatus]
MFDVFPSYAQLHELLWYLTEALGLPAAAPSTPSCGRRWSGPSGSPGGPPGNWPRWTWPRTGQEVNVAAAAHAASWPGPAPAAKGKGKGKDRRGADLIGARLKGADLRGASLRGACLIAADLTGADLRGADLIGADLRDTDLTDADLTGAFFLTQPQVNAARGSAGTRLPESVGRPVHWTAGG